MIFCASVTHAQTDTLQNNNPPLDTLPKRDSLLFIQDTIAKILVPNTNLDSLLFAETISQKKFISASFQGTRIINGHSVEIPGKGVMQLMFSHRFGTLENIIYDFFGLDQARMRFGFDFGISKRIAIGVGRSTLQKAYDGYFKFKFLRQSSGSGEIPFTIVLIGTAAVNSQKDAEIKKFEHRLYYAGQLLIARKFTKGFSLQIMPTIVHRNLTEKPSEKNMIYAMGIAGRLKLSKRIALTGEFYYNIENQLGSGFYNPVSIGIDIETGGHVFQLHFTNSQGMIEHQFIGMTNSNIYGGFKAIRMGFNFSRVFTVVRYNIINSSW